MRVWRKWRLLKWRPTWKAVKKTWRRLKALVGLSRGDFNGTNWETALDKVVARIEVLRGTREDTIHLLTKETVDNLRRCQEEAALIRAEYLIRELRAYVAANEFLEPYCKRIVNRLFSIEKLRTCPTDLSREISGLVFASSRCLDIPELEDFTTLVKKEFGEEFVHVATELRGGCDVNNMLIKMLSTRTPESGEKKMVLRMIADSNNIAFRILFNAEEAREEALEDVPIVYDTRGEHSYIESHEEESTDKEFYSPSPSPSPSVSPSPPQLLAVPGVPYKVIDGEAVWRYLTNKKESYSTLIMSKLSDMLAPA